MRTLTVSSHTLRKLGVLSLSAIVEQFRVRHMGRNVEGVLRTVRLAPPDPRRERQSRVAGGSK